MFFCGQLVTLVLVGWCSGRPLWIICYMMDGWKNDFGCLTNVDTIRKCAVSIGLVCAVVVSWFRY